MFLQELFPEMPKVKIGEQEYELKYSTRAMLVLESNYPNPEDITKVVQSAMTGMKVSDIVNFLQAGLLGAGLKIDKEQLIDEMKPEMFSEYAAAIMVGYINSTLTKEQVEKLELMAQQDKGKKKVKE